jgi:hypothetical protein
MHHRILSRILPALTAFLITLAMAIPARAAISNGPKYTNSVDAEQQRIAQFYQAEQSFQQKLKVGRDRYNQKQINRAKIIQAMSSELQARQLTVGSPAVPVHDKITVEPASEFRPSLVVAALAIGLIGLVWHRNRQSAQKPLVRKRNPVLEPLPKILVTSKAD